MGNEILFYVPNIIGYIRLALLFVSLVVYNSPITFLSLYGISIALDAVDGILARRLDQTSVFGAWFDVLIDLISRGALWCFISKLQKMTFENRYNFSKMTFENRNNFSCYHNVLKFSNMDFTFLMWGYCIMMIEWLTFVCTHARGGNWKVPDEEFPAICRMVMAKGFKTPIGTYAITGIFVLPLWIYGMMSGFLDDYLGLPTFIQYFLLVCLIGGRMLAMTTELFYIKQHIKGLLAEDATEKSTPS